MTKGSPDFICVGGEKCGTTALYYYLQQHPQLWIPSKDTYFFNQDTISTLGLESKIYSEEAYRQLFSGPEANAAVSSGEVASFYLYCYQEVIERIKKYVGDPRILILLRQPADRAWSNYQHYVRDLRESRSFVEAVDEELKDSSVIPKNRHYVRMGFYSSAVEAFMGAFSEVKVILFDDLVDRPSDVMSDLYQWLGADDSFRPDFSARYNSSGVPKHPWIHWLFFAPHAWKLKLKDALLKTGVSEESFVRLIDSLRRRNLQKGAMPTDVRERLMDLYRPEIRLLQDLIGRDLSGWMR